VFQEERGRLVLEPSDFSAILSLEGTLKDFPLERTLQEERAKPKFQIVLDSNLLIHK
jgi:hypothetical protein